MFPVLWQFKWHDSQITIGSYTAALLVATIATILLGMYEAARHGLPAKQVAGVLILAGLAAFPGARAFHFLTHRESYSTAPELIWSLHPVGLSLAGGVAAAALVGAILCRCLSLSVWKTADVVMPAVLLGTAILRLGCFGHGCCFGTPTGLPWGVTYPLDSPAATQQMLSAPWILLTGPARVHPVQLYESAALLIAVLITIRLPATRPFGLRITSTSLLLALIHGACLFLRDPPSDSHHAHLIAGGVDIAVVTGAMVLLYFGKWRS